MGWRLDRGWLPAPASHTQLPWDRARCDGSRDGRGDGEAAGWAAAMPPDEQGDAAGSGYGNSQAAMRQGR